jgi:hypothetical protein
LLVQRLPGGAIKADHFEGDDGMAPPFPFVNIRRWLFDLGQSGRRLAAAGLDCLAFSSDHRCEHESCPDQSTLNHQLSNFFESGLVLHREVVR